MASSIEPKRAAHVGCRRMGVPCPAMAIDEDLLREMNAAVFNSGVSPARPYVQFFAEAMRWPVDAFAPQTTHTGGDTEHRVTWIKNDAIGHAVYTRPSEIPEVSATVRPVSSVTRVEIGSTVHDDGFSQSVTRSLTVHFADGEPLIVDLAKFSVSTQRGQADAFIDAVLDALA